MKAWHTNPETYYTSSKYVEPLVKKEGISAFKFEILFTCKGKGALRAAEMELQIRERVLDNPNNFNRHIGHLMWYNDRIGHLDMVHYP